MPVSNSLMSAPATKVLPAQPSTMALMPGLPRSSVKTCFSPARTPWLTALTGGLSIMTTAMSPAMEKVTGSLTLFLLGSDAKRAIMVIFNN